MSHSAFLCQFSDREFRVPTGLGSIRIWNFGVPPQQLPDYPPQRGYNHTKPTHFRPPAVGTESPLVEPLDISDRLSRSDPFPAPHSFEQIQLQPSRAAREVTRWEESRPGEALIEGSRASGPELADIARQSQDLLLEMLKERFELAVDILLQQKTQNVANREARLAVLFELYEEGILTKGEVRQRGDLEPEDFYNELRAFRLRNA